MTRSRRQTDPKTRSVDTVGADKVKKGRMKMRRGITLDSGSHHNVMPKRMVRKANIRPSPGSKRGLHYIAANEGKIANEGETDFKFETLGVSKRAGCFKSQR